MGHCTSDIYKTAKRQYGEIFQKLVIQQECLIKFKQWVRGKQQQYDSKLANKKDSLDKEIDQRQQLLTNNFTQAKINLQSHLPYGVSSYEQMRKTSLQNLLGLEGYRRKFQQVHTDVQTQSNQNKENFHRQAEQIIKKVEQESKLDHQKLKPFHDLPQEKKKFIYDKGVKEFEKQIATRLSELENAHLAELNPDTNLEKLNNIISTQQLDNVITQSAIHFRNQTANIVGNNLDSDIKI